MNDMTYACSVQTYQCVNELLKMKIYISVLLSISDYFSKRGSQVCCQLANYVSKFGSWAGTSQRSSQVLFKVPFFSFLINLFKKAFFVLGDHWSNIVLQ